MSKKRVVVAMSGGVDSSVAACLLKDAGYEVVGMTMRLHSDDSDEFAPLNRGCCTIDDYDDAKRVCQSLDIPHYTLNFEQDFKTNVIDYFVSEYSKGRTPHPCIACNDKVKFAPLMEKALAFGADYLATGHYARVGKEGGVFRLLKAIDPLKDQSYVLYNLGQESLSRVLFPMGAYTKNRIRDIAREAGLLVADKKDSQEICFVPSTGYRQFVAERTSPVPGEIVDTSGRVVGLHKGIESFTIGQRRGLGINTNEVLYVVGLDPDAHTVIVGSHEDLFSDFVMAGNVSYVNGDPGPLPLEIGAKIRYNAGEAPAVLLPKGQGAEVRFEVPQRAVTPGQAIVFYQGDEVIGGGVIDQVMPRFRDVDRSTRSESVGRQSKKGA